VMAGLFAIPNLVAMALARPPSLLPGYGRKGDSEMTPQECMNRAIEIAASSMGEPGALPYGAVVARDGQIIGEGLNRAMALSDPTAHGEVEAIRDACRRLGTTDLSGAAMYTTAEPCSMCVATMLLCGIERLYYAADAETSAALMKRLAGSNPSLRRRFSMAEVRAEVARPVDERQMPAERLGVEEVRSLFDAYAAKHG
jgi:guanine deaminase